MRIAVVKVSIPTFITGTGEAQQALDQLQHLRRKFQVSRQHHSGNVGIIRRPVGKAGCL